MNCDFSALQVQMILSGEVALILTQIATNGSEKTLVLGFSGDSPVNSITQGIMWV